MINAIGNMAMGNLDLLGSEVRTQYSLKLLNWEKKLISWGFISYFPECQRQVMLYLEHLYTFA